MIARASAETQKRAIGGGWGDTALPSWRAGAGATLGAGGGLPSLPELNVYLLIPLYML